MKRILISALCLVSLPLAAQKITSPSGNLSVDVECIGGRPTYTVVLGSDTLLRRSPLGMKTNIGDYTKGLQIGKMSSVTRVSEMYSLKNAKIRNISYDANEATYEFVTESGKKAFGLVMHVDENNIAFKYLLSQQGERKSCLVEKESTGYVFPVETKTFLCPQMHPQTGFARTAPSYETYYEYDADMGKNGHGLGYTFPALFRVGEKGWVMLSETNVGGNYCGSRIVSSSVDSYSLAFPDAKEFGGVGSVEPGIMLPGETPWRTISVGKTLAPIAETTIQWDLVKPQYDAKTNYEYGASAWSWIIRMDNSCNYDEQVEYVDFAAKMGWKYLLVDALWDTQIGYDRMEQLSKYAQSKGIGLFLWYNSNGYWNDAPQGPRGKMHRMIDRRKEMAWLHKIGVKGLKIDFVGSDKQQTMQMYEDILADANDYELMIIFHGCTLQRGWERMYPNFVACEAVRASENLSFGQYDNDIEALAATIHPVLRNAVGNMDFGGSALNKFYSKDNIHGRQRKTSDVYALATAVLFQTPVQNFALAPNNLTDASAWAIDFMKTVPCTWEEERFISGYPGKNIVLARKHDGKWFLAAVNAEKKPLTLKLDLSGMFEVGETVSLYTDDAALNGGVKQVKLNKKKSVTVTIPCNGGLVIK